MPYIKLSQRDRYNPLILESVQAIMNGNESKLQKGEFFGFLLTRIVKGYMSSMDKKGPAFNSSLFSPPKLAKLSELADKFLIFLNQDEPLDSAGELNYVLSAILWGVQGQAEGVEAASYGFRTYLRSMVEQVKHGLPSFPFTTSGEQKERLKAGRRFTVAMGVLGDVISETYQQVTTPYENGKRKENGTIWVNGKLVSEA